MRLLEGKPLDSQDKNIGLSAEAENFLEHKILEILAKAKKREGITEPDDQA